MIVVMEETASDEQVSKAIERIVELGFDIYRTTGARYTILGAVGSRPIEQKDVEAMKSLAGVRDVVRISGPSVKKINRVSGRTARKNPRVHFRHLTIFGVGLIGGSFALAAREAGIASKITGTGDKEFLQSALSLGVIDGVDESFANDDFSTADLILLAAPVKAICEFLKAKGKLIQAGAIVTDTGSAKREICRTARESLPPGVNFIGGHPMSGSHKVGVEFATGELFRNAPYILIEEEGEGHLAAARRQLRLVVEEIGGRVVSMTAGAHDALVARVSHAPQLISTALANSIQKSQGKKSRQIAGAGFADMTRLARSQWSVWEDIVESNSDEIASALAEISEVVSRLKRAVEEKDAAELKKAFESANDFLSE